MNLLKMQQEIISLIDKNQFKEKAKFIGIGEFSDVYSYKDIVIKISHNTSLHNPNNYTKEQFSKISNRVLKEELDTYNLLKPSSILPNPFYLFEYKQIIYILREFGEIYLQEEEIGKFLPKWKKGSVKLHEYQILVKELYLIAKNKGIFEDLLQIAERKDGSLFLFDLGYFNGDLKNNDLIYRYNWLNTKISNLNDQVGLKPQLPMFVIEDYITFYQEEYDYRAKEDQEFADKSIGKELRKWKELKQEYEKSNWYSFEFHKINVK